MINCRRLFVIALVATFEMISAIVTANARTPRWTYTGTMGDWSGRDYACSQGQVPVRPNCTTTSRGTVAVCWLSRRTGECQDATSWCTYKTVQLGEPHNGLSPGHVYVCR